MPLSIVYMSVWSVSLISILALVSIILIGLFIMKNRRRFDINDHDNRAPFYVPPWINLNQQSKLVISPKNEKIHFSIFNKNETTFVEKFHDRVETLYDNFAVACENFSDAPCLGTRVGQEYQWVKFKDVMTRAKNFGSALIKMGLKPGQETYIGIYAKNRLEWDLCAIGCYHYSMVVVPLYDTLGPEAAAYIINQTNMELIVCDDEKKVRKLLSDRQKVPKLKYIVLTDDCMVTKSDDLIIQSSIEKTVITVDDQNTNSDNSSGNYDENANKTGSILSNIALYRMGQLEKSGALLPQAPVQLPRGENLYIICYTSGTTGTPKGVMITHKMMICQLAILRMFFETFKIELTRQDVTISYLPMAHMFNQMLHALSFSSGCRVGYLSGAVGQLTEDMQILKPSFFVVVPRLLNKVVDSVKHNVANASFIKRALFNFAYRKKLQLLQQHGEIRRDTFWDRLVFKKVQQSLGGNVRFMVTASAPILPEVKQFAWCTLGSVLVEAYGQTEVTAGISCTMPNDTDTSHVGALLPNCIVKLADVPDLEYFAKDDVGEVCIKGPCQSLGYFKEPRKTDELFDKEGWLRTGDIGRWNPNGTLSIIDRQKNILKLAQGEYVAPEKIESVYTRCPIVLQVFVDGCSHETCLVAIVVAEKSWFAHHPIAQHAYRDDDAFWHDAKTEQFLLDELQKVGRAANLSPLEQVKAVRVSPEAFTLENELLTPTMKSRRPMLRKRFAQDINEMYRGMKK